MSLSLSRPALQQLVTSSIITRDPLEGHRRAMTAQDKYNLDVEQALQAVTPNVVWTNLTPINSWTAFDSVNNTSPAWWQDPTGRVWLRGLIAGGSAGVNMFSTLVPASTSNLIITLCALSYDGTNLKPAQVSIVKNGNVQLTKGSTTFVSLDSLNYMP